MQRVADACHDRGAGQQAARDIGSDARREVQQRRALHRLAFRREHAQCRRRVSGPAAKARGDRDVLDQMKRAAGLASPQRRISASGLLQQIVALKRAGERPGHAERERTAGAIFKDVAEIGEQNQAFQLVITVRPPALDLKRQVNFGACQFRRRVRRIEHGTSARTGKRRLDAAHFASVAEGLLASSDARVFGSSVSPASSFFLILASSSASGLRSSACFHWNFASS